MLSIIAQQEVAFTLNRWAKEAAMYFCNLAQQEGCQFQNVVYPTGLKMVRASVGSECAEVPLRQAKQLRAAGYKLVC